MSLKAMVWALEEAGVADAGQLLVLIALAERADEDGRNAWPGRPWLAQRARCSTRTVQRHLNALLEQGLIVHGDQRIVEHLRADRRPTVYDLTLNSQTPDQTRQDNLTPRPSSEENPPSGPSPRSGQPAHGEPPMTPRTCGQHRQEGTPVSPRSPARGDTGSSHGVTPVAHKPSLLPSEETAATSAPVDKQRQRATTRLDPMTLRLQAELDGAGFDAVRWSGLTQAELIEVSDLAVQHGIPRLVQSAQAARQSHIRPPGHARAWLTIWRDLRRPRPPAAGRCDLHHDSFPCRGCAADAKASR